MIKRLIFLTILLLSFSLTSCKKQLPIEQDLSGLQFEMLNQDSMKVFFPKDLSGRIIVMGYIFTHCPDICPMTTNNMYRIQQRLIKENVHNIQFISLTFDPARDYPSVLKQYAEIRDIETKQWEFLTTDQQVLDSLKNKLHFLAVAGDTTYSDNGKANYYFVHTDRISLIDELGRVRKNYKGSEINIDEIIADIKDLNS